MLTNIIKIIFLLLMVFGTTVTSSAQNNKTDSLNFSLPDLQTLVMSQSKIINGLENIYELKSQLNSVNLVNHSLDGIRKGFFTISEANLKKENYFNYQDNLKPTTKTALRNIMPNYDLMSAPLPSHPTF